MSKEIRHLAAIRALVGYLGEQPPAWWGSQFFNPAAAAFLGPVFTRSMFQAQLQGVSAAAARVHDERIGVGRTLHLFRMPEILEQSVAGLTADAGFAAVLAAPLSSREAALERLASLGRPQVAVEGPMLVGEYDGLTASLLGTLAGAYHDAFARGIQTFPFMRGD